MYAVGLPLATTPIYRALGVQWACSFFFEVRLVRHGDGPVHLN